MAHSLLLETGDYRYYPDQIQALGMQGP